MMCFQSVSGYTICFRSGYTHMRHDEVALLSEEGRGQARELGSKLARLRAARKRASLLPSSRAWPRPSSDRRATSSCLMCVYPLLKQIVYPDTDWKHIIAHAEKH